MTVAHFNSQAPRNKPELGFNRMRFLKIAEKVESHSLDSFPGTPRPTAIQGDIQQHLTTLADSEKYQLALVPRTTPEFSGSSDSSIRFVTMQVALLPLTWRDISRFVREETRTSALNSSLNNGVAFGEVSVDLYRMRVTRRGEEVLLTALEFKVLRFLIINRGRAISRDELLNQVWGYNHYPCTRTVDNHVMRLRQKLEADPANPIHFRTVHRIGYRFVA